MSLNHCRPPAVSGLAAVGAGLLWLCGSLTRFSRPSWWRRCWPISAIPASLVGRLAHSARRGGGNGDLRSGRAADAADPDPHTHGLSRAWRWCSGYPTLSICSTARYCHGSRRSSASSSELDAGAIRKWLAGNWDTAQDVLTLLLAQARTGGLALVGVVGEPVPVCRW